MMPLRRKYKRHLGNLKGNNILLVRKHDLQYLRLAEFIAGEFSKDPSTKVGAVLINDRRQTLSFGYNGYPIGVEDINLDNREYKYPRMVHAEINAILNSNSSLMGATMYSTLAPCSSCAGPIIQSGIKYVFHIQENYDCRPGIWQESHKIALDMFRQAGVECFGVYINGRVDDPVKINHY